MNKKIPPVLLLLALAALSLRAQSDSAAGTTAMSAEMRAIVTSLRPGGHDLNVSGLPKMGKEAAAAFDSKGMETCNIPPPPGTADMFSYTVYYDKAQGKYWISRTGGFAGVQELYGPMTAPATSK